MEEIWRPIVGYEGLYEVSSYGRVRSLDRCLVNSLGKVVHIKGKILKGGDNGLGYKFVYLKKDGINNNRYVHRLVAETFIPRPEGLYEVNHKDEDKSNNSVENLEWCDHKYNMNYGDRMNKVYKKKIESGYWTFIGLSDKERGVEYYKKHREKRLEYQKDYYYRNKDRILEYHKLRYQKKKVK